ncbi:uncharacterized protein PRCAT00004795001 [Priceomyces carsonii]|uniref:uncharacterized protein n=1 Tax=Priceomyces carsonii TaxID=28549 RepID=UPI002EDA87FD|nr:unnamed protein product [Priceomyces carsonii]
MSSLFKLLASPIARRYLSRSAITYKPFDFQRINAQAKGSGGLNLDQLLNNPAKYHDKAPNGHGKENNRFAMMFDPNNIGKTKHHPLDKKLGPKHKSRTKKNDGGHNKQTRKLARFQFETGSEQAQNAIKSIITKIHTYNKNYNVSYVDPDNNKLVTKHLVEIVNNLDLGHKGLHMVPPNQSLLLPLVKVSKVSDMIRLYTDELAEIREQELLEKGSIAAQKAVRQRDRAEKKKSSTKIITLAWNISVGDLKNQKRAEISKRLAKGEKFLLYIGEKRSLYSARKSVDKEGGIIETLKEGKSVVDNGNMRKYEDDELEIEMRRHEMIYQQIQEMLDELQCEYDISGDLDSRIIISCSPKRNLSSKHMEEHDSELELSKKEVKRQKKLAKQKELELKKSQQKAKESDLDSLYLFKIED